jgi:hypothetical protein
MVRKEFSYTAFHYGKRHKTKNRTPMWSSNSTPRVDQAFSCSCHYWTNPGVRGDAEMTDDRRQNCGQVCWVLGEAQQLHCFFYFSLLYSSRPCSFTIL